MIPSSWLPALALQLLLVASVAAQSVPSFTVHDPQTAFVVRDGAACAYDVHAFIGAGTAQTGSMWSLGGMTAAGALDATYDYSTTGVFTQATSTLTPTFSYAPANSPLARTFAFAGLLSSRNLIFGSGNVAGTRTNDVIVSSNNGQSWDLATANAQFSAREQSSYNVQPGSNIFVIAGGIDGSGNVLNDVWMSQDGRGATWTQMTAAASSNTRSIDTFASGNVAFLYALNGSPAVMLLWDSVSNELFSSSNLGQSFTYSGQISGIPAGSATGLIIDGSNRMFVSTAVNGGVQWYISSDNGLTFQQMTLSTSGTNYPSVIFTNTYFNGGCLGLTKSASATAPGGSHLTLTQYGGFLSGYTATCPINGYYSTVTVDIAFPQETPTFLYQGVRSASDACPPAIGSGSSSLSSGAIAGSVIGAVVGFLLLACLIIYCCSSKLGIRFGRTPAGSSSMNTNQQESDA